jgi:cyclopropane fatty-acyl-phospholipid synthase-like methyltransferase
MSSPPFSEACERNKEPILEALGQLFPSRGQVLEIGSCTGQHIVFFAPSFSALSWQPSDQMEYLEGLSARIRLEGSPNILEAIELDVLKEWPGQLFDAVYSSNTAHIMSWESVCAMFAGVGKCLLPGGVFCLYGPFNEGGRFTSASNEEFDRSLRARDPAQGIRDLDALDSLALGQQMKLQQQFRLPANNCLLVFRKNRAPIDS